MDAKEYINSSQLDEDLQKCKFDTQPCKVKVSIEETLCKTIEIEVPAGVGDPLEWAEAKAKEMHKNREIVLTADDFNGQRCMMIEDEHGFATNWFDF